MPFQKAKQGGRTPSSAYALKKATLANWIASNHTLYVLNVISVLSFPSPVKNMGVLPEAKILS